MTLGQLLSSRIFQAVEQAAKRFCHDRSVSIVGREPITGMNCRPLPLAQSSPTPI
jgi:hypothetical protein